MLDPKERARLLELQKKDAKPYTPLKKGALKVIEERNAAVLLSPTGSLFYTFTDAWNNVAGICKTISEDNVRLISEVRFLQDKMDAYDKMT